MQDALTSQLPTPARAIVNLAGNIARTPISALGLPSLVGSGGSGTGGTGIGAGVGSRPPTGGGGAFGFMRKKAKTNDNGGSFMKNVPTMVGAGAQPELFMPTTSGTAIPNIDKMLGNKTISIGTINVNADTYEGGQAAGNGAYDAIMTRARAQGFDIAGLTG